MNKNTKLLNTSLIAAIYVVLCLILQPISYGPIQFRLAEILCLLAIEFPFAITGVTIGCFISNLLFGSLGIIDTIFGSIATLLGTYLAYRLRNKKINNLPILSIATISIINSLIIGVEYGYIFHDESMIIITIIQVLISELIVLIIGLPFYNKLITIIKNKL